jgi:hypothetical protein
VASAEVDTNRVGKKIIVLKLFFQKRIKSPLCGWNGQSEGGKGDEKEILIFDYTNKGRTYKLVC